MSKYLEKLSSHDLFLELEAFTEGRSTHAWRCFGTHPAKDENDVDGYLFRVWAPNAPKVTVIGDFNNWDLEATPMTKVEGGIWEAFVPGLNRYDAYQYRHPARRVHQALRPGHRLPVGRPGLVCLPGQKSPLPPAHEHL